MEIIGVTTAEGKKLVIALFTVFLFALTLWQTSSSIALDSEGSAEPPEGFVAVSRVVDGDTIVVMMGEEEYKVRLIGMNAPESVDPRRGVECFGKEASAYLAELLGDSAVELFEDQTQSAVDRYGRLLRVVYREDGTDVGEQMIRDGYAFEYTYDVPYEKQEEYRAAEAYAEREGLGLWSPKTCDGEP